MNLTQCILDMTNDMFVFVLLSKKPTRLSYLQRFQLHQLPTVLQLHWRSSWCRNRLVEGSWPDPCQETSFQLKQLANWHFFEAFKLAHPKCHSGSLLNHSWSKGTLSQNKLFSKSQRCHPPWTCSPQKPETILLQWIFSRNPLVPGNFSKARVKALVSQ